MDTKSLQGYALPVRRPFDASAESAPQPVFATTQWSVVMEARGQDSAAASAALERLCFIYWYPVYAEVRRRGHGPHDAEDLTQEFFACLLRRNSFAQAEESKGRLRSYLIGALNYFLADHRERQHAEKRGGKVQILSLDQEGERRYLDEPAQTETPEALFDRRWRTVLMEEAFSRLRSEYAEKKPMFETLKGFLAADVKAGEYDEPARKLGMTSSTVAVAVHRIRQRYAELVRSIVAETLANPAELDDELRQLFR